MSSKISKLFKQVYLIQSAKTIHLTFEECFIKLSSIFCCLRNWIFFCCVYHFLAFTTLTKRVAAILKLCDPAIITSREVIIARSTIIFCITFAQYFMLRHFLEVAFIRIELASFFNLFSHSDKNVFAQGHQTIGYHNVSKELQDRASSSRQTVCITSSHVLEHCCCQKFLDWLEMCLSQHTLR